MSTIPGSVTVTLKMDAHTLVWRDDAWLCTHCDYVPARIEINPNIKEIEFVADHPRNS